VSWLCHGQQQPSPSCKDNPIPIVVFDVSVRGKFRRAVAGGAIRHQILPDRLAPAFLAHMQTSWTLDYRSEHAQVGESPPQTHLQHNPHGPCQPFPARQTLSSSINGAKHLCVLATLFGPKNSQTIQTPAFDRWFDGRDLEKAIAIEYSWGFTPKHNDASHPESTFAFDRRFAQRDSAKPWLQVGRRGERCPCAQTFVVRRG